MQTKALLTCLALFLALGSFAHVDCRERPHPAMTVLIPRPLTPKPWIDDSTQVVSYDGHYYADSAEPIFGATQGVEVWRTDSWRPIAFLPLQGMVCAVAFTPNSHSLVVASGDENVVLWDFATHTIRRFRGLDGRPFYAAVSANGRWVAVAASETSMTRVWDRKTGKGFTLEDVPGPMAFSPDSTKMAYGYTKSTSWQEPQVLMVIDLRTRARHTLLYSDTFIQAMRYTSDGRYLLISDEGGASLINAKTGSTSLFDRFDKNPPTLNDSNPNEAGYKNPADFPYVTFPPGLRRVNRAPTKSAPLLPALSNLPAGSAYSLGRWYTVAVAARYELSEAHSPDYSPNGRFVAFETAVHIDPLDESPLRVLDLTHSRLSPPLNTYGDRTWWSANSRYLAVYDEADIGPKYRYTPTLYCWDMLTGKVRIILATEEAIHPTWTPAGKLKVQIGKDTYLFNPINGRIQMPSKAY